PVAAIESIDPAMRVIRIGKLRRDLALTRTRIQIVTDGRVVRDAMARVKPQLDRAMADIKLHEAAFVRIRAMTPALDADIKQALADARAQVAQIDDKAIRARIDAALARAQAKIDQANANVIFRAEAPAAVEDDSDMK
ncbi:MAG TPA: hypothetical protein VGB91_14995, partial [Rhizomicrobium sp.]